MGLRILTNIGGLTALRNITQATQRETEALERIATGREILRAAQGPARLFIIDMFRGQLARINQAVENTQNAVNLVRTAEGGLAQISEQLVNVRGLVIQAMNTGVGGGATTRALQNALDQAINAIDRIAQTTRFNGQTLLNGNLGFTIANASPELTNIRVFAAQFDGTPPVQVTVNVVNPATRAQVEGTIAEVQSQAATVRITGPLGSRDINIPAGATQAEVEAMINEVREYTGVEAEAGVIRTTEYGSRAFVQIEVLTGTFENIVPGRYTGTDIEAIVQGQQAQGNGTVLTVNTPGLNAQITVQPGVTGTFTFNIVAGGATFQLGESPLGTDRLTIGIGPVGATNLGETSGIGNLATLRTGGENSILANPRNALRIIEAAAREVGQLRERLGAFESRIFEPNLRALNVAYENIAASTSAIADADIARQVSIAIRNRLVREFGINVLRQTNLNAGIVLRLLT